ncbi:MAG: hypothetical protein M1812_001592 [Candelaria pacifica]|nr:MAG: hypothetical protein M1812_001592 [Candelaria pacifica]
MVRITTMRRCLYAGAVAAFASSALINAAPAEDVGLVARDDTPDAPYNAFSLDRRGDDTTDPPADDDKDDITDNLLTGDFKPPSLKNWKGKKEDHVDWKKVGLKTAGTGDATPDDPQDDTKQSKRSVEGVGLEARAPPLSPILTTRYLRDTNLLKNVYKNTKDGIAWFFIDNEQKDIDKADKDFEPKYRATFTQPGEDAIKNFQADHCYPLQFYMASVGARDNQLYKGVDDEEASKIDKESWKKWTDVLTRKNKATSKEELQWHSILKQAINHPSNVDMVLTNANQIEGHADRYSIKEMLKLKDNKGFTGPAPKYSKYVRTEGGLAAFVRAGNQDRCEQYVEYMGDVSSKIMAKWDKDGAKHLKKQVIGLNKKLWKGSLDGTDNGIVNTIKDKPDHDKKDGLKYAKEDMKLTWDDIKKMATQD